MDTVQMGELIRNARKEKNLTQKDIAEKLGITDRAVSKWERGICAPDITYIEELADMLSLTVSELIAGQRMEQPPAQEVVSAVKETISYSKNEVETKSKAINRKLVAFGLTAVVICLILFVSYLWYTGYFHIIERISAPDGTMIATVYDCTLYSGEPPVEGGFTLRESGTFNSWKIYQNASFRGLWWSANSKLCVVSMDTPEGVYLTITDHNKYHNTSNLTLILEQFLVENAFFADIAHEGEKWSPLVSIDFVQWSDADPETMLVYFAYTDKDGQLREGYMWYDYESHKASGYMKLEE